MVYRPKIDDKLCFILMPFREPFNGHYEHIIRKVVKNSGLEPLRADEIFGTRSIIRDVWDHIWRARVVIADVTDRNPNVNYELGLCHSLGVPTILITQRMEDVPFDYRHRRCIVYRTEEATWIEKLSAALKSTIEALLLGGEADHELRWPYDTFVVKQLVGADSTMIIENPRPIIHRGMTRVERLVSRAFGPVGANISVALSSQQVVSHKQGSVIARGVHSANPIEEKGIEQMRKAARHISDVVGDGTKTAMILTYALVDGGLVALSQGYPLKDILHGIDNAVTIAKSSIIGQAQRCSVDRLAEVAATAAEDDNISGLVLDALKTAGKDGVIIIETKSGAASELIVQEGLRFDQGYLSDKFVTNPETGECELRDGRILVHDAKISNMKDLLPLLEEVACKGEPLLIIADDVEGEALATLVVNRARGTLLCAAVKAPGFGDRRKALLEDIAVLTGARFASRDWGQRLDSVRLVDLGAAQRIVITEHETTIFGGQGAEQGVAAHANAVRAAIDRAVDPRDREKLQERLANLAGKIATIRVGGTTDFDVEDRKYRVASALHSARAAIEEGVCCGGGVAFLNAKEAVSRLSFQTEGQKAGASIVEAALGAPFSALAETCNKSPVSVLSDRQRHGQPTMGLNVEKGELSDMLTSGILDPVKSLCTALDAAQSCALEVLRTEIWSLSPTTRNAPGTENDVAS